MHLVLLIALAQAAAAGPLAPIPPAEWPEFVRSGSQAIAAKDVLGVAQFLERAIVPADGSDAWKPSPADVLKELDGCRQAKVTRSGEAYILHFSCPSHPRGGCDSGDISVLLMKQDWKQTLVLGHDRKVSAACPLFVAPPLARREPPR